MKKHSDKLFIFLFLLTIFVLLSPLLNDRIEAQLGGGSMLANMSSAIWDGDSNGYIDLDAGGTNADLSGATEIPAARNGVAYAITNEATLEEILGIDIIVSTEMVGANETYGSGWNADTGLPEKDDIYDQLHKSDTDDDGYYNDEDFISSVTIITVPTGTALFTLSGVTTATRMKASITAIDANTQIILSETLAHDGDSYTICNSGVTPILLPSHAAQQWIGNSGVTVTLAQLECFTFVYETDRWIAQGYTDTVSFQSINMSSGTIQGAVKVYTDATTGVTVADGTEMNGYYLLTNDVACDIEIPANMCDSATGYWLVVTKSVGHATVSIHSQDGSDVFILSDGTITDADDEIDLESGTSEAMTCILCDRANHWKVTGEIGTTADGGAAD